MSRFILGDCVQVMSRFPSRAVDFILTDPPYLVGYKDRTGRTLAGDNSPEWLQPACHEMYRVLKNDSLMVSFYAWNRADLFINAWKSAGFRIVGHIVFAKSYASKSTFVGYAHESAFLLAKGRPKTPERPIHDVIPWQYTGKRVLFSTRTHERFSDVKAGILATIEVCRGRCSPADAAMLDSAKAMISVLDAFPSFAALATHPGRIN
ncbi:DNA methyltransferase [Enterobacter hormaechei]|uniref:DNA methyltransferase n=1 Tax=Enterobacter hormaechei TaxID=158836 RepID=UPI003134378F